MKGLAKRNYNLNFPACRKTKLLQNLFYFNSRKMLGTVNKGSIDDLNTTSIKKRG